MPLAKPCLREFLEDVALPALVLGPVVLRGAKAGVLIRPDGSRTIWGWQRKIAFLLGNIVFNFCD